MSINFINILFNWISCLNPYYNGKYSMRHMTLAGL